MDIAYDIKKMGNPIRVNAYGLNEDSISSKSNRFACIVCGEFVAYIHNRNGVKFFKHKMKNENTIECEKRISLGMATYNFYEIKGSPIYIKKEASNVFKMYIAFSGLGVTIHDHLRKYKTILNICGEKTKKKSVDEYNFNVDENTLIEVDFLPVNNTYRFEYDVNNANTKKQLMKKWSDFSDFQSESGALFSFTESGGRKISKGGFIYSNTPYLYLTDKKIKNYLGLEYDFQGILELGKKSFNVYRIMYIEFEKSVFEFSCDFCRAGLNLIYKSLRPQLIKLWPPAFKENDEYNVINDSETFYFLMKIHDNKSIVYRNTEKSSEEIDIQKINESTFLSKIPINKHNTSISFNSHTSEQEIIINNRDKILSTIKPEIVFLNDNIKKTNHIKCGEYYHVDSNIDIEIFSIMNKKEILNIYFKNDNRNLCFIKETELWAKINDFIFNIGPVVKIKDHSMSIMIDDLGLYRRLKMSENTRVENFDNINTYISLLRGYPISYRYVNNFVINRRMPIGMKRVLIELGGGNYGKY